MNARQCRAILAIISMQSRFFSRSILPFLISAVPIALALLFSIYSSYAFDQPMEEWKAEWDITFFLGFSLCFVFTIPVFFSILYQNSLLNRELENKTIYYLFTRPLARAWILIAQYIGNILGLSLILMLSLLLTWFMAVFPDVGDLRLLFYISFGSLSALISYGALFFCLGTLFPDRNMSTAIFYLIIIECGLSMIPTIGQSLSINYHLRIFLIQSYLYIHPELNPLVKDVLAIFINIDSPTNSIWQLLLTLFSFTLVSLAISTFLISKREWKLG